MVYLYAAPESRHEEDNNGVGWYGSDQEKRRRRARVIYEFEMALREEGHSDFVYDEEQDLFRFPDGKFAFSKEWANVELLQKRGYFG
jgi:hypothetical protein